MKSGVFLVALEELDRNALRPSDEADAHAGADSGRLFRELDALGPDLGGDRVDVFNGQPEMIETLIGLVIQLWIFDIMPLYQGLG